MMDSPRAVCYRATAKVATDNLYGRNYRQGPTFTTIYPASGLGLDYMYTAGVPFSIGVCDSLVYEILVRHAPPMIVLSVTSYLVVRVWQLPRCVHLTATVQ